MKAHRLAAVATVPFFAQNRTGIDIALKELLRLRVRRVVLVYDEKAASKALALAAIATFRKLFAHAGLRLEGLCVDEDDTTLRWKLGVLHAAKDKATDAVFVFPCDFRRKPTDRSRQGWKAMVSKVRRNGLSLGDYTAVPGSFKADFENLIGRTAVEILFPAEAKALNGTGLRRLRTEFFVVGVDLLKYVRKLGIIWTLDPTIDFTLTCLRESPKFTASIVPIEFEDEAGRRDPMGQLFQLTRFCVLLALNAIRLEPRRSDPVQQALAYDGVRNRLKAVFSALVNAIDQNRPPLSQQTTTDQYEKWRAKLRAICGIKDRVQLHTALPGRVKYRATAVPKPFEGISVIHNVDSKTARAIGFAGLLKRLKHELKKAGGLHDNIAFVDLSTVHATTFDLINKPEHSTTLRNHKYDYRTVRKEVERTAIEWLQETNFALRAEAEIVGVGMFAPAVLKLDIRLHPDVARIFQAFRLAIHKRLSSIDGYSFVRPPNWDAPLAGHLTLGYILKPFSEQQIEALLSVLQRFNEKFKPIPMELTQGEVTAFTNMDHYRPVRVTAP